MSRGIPFIPYPSINAHGVIGDRRTAALTASDGTIDWMCLPDYDGKSVFGALLDATCGGYWRLGPQLPASGRQTYIVHSAAVATSWADDSGELELTDVMLWPQENRRDSDDGRRVVARRLRCTHGAVHCRMDLRPRLDCATAAQTTAVDGGVQLQLGEHRLQLWTSCAVQMHEDGVEADFSLDHGEEMWAVLSWEEQPNQWSIEALREAFEQTQDYWHTWQQRLTYAGPRSQRIEHSALIVHLLGYAPTGALVAAPTTSLPERIGGEHNYDYRYTWVRDASLSVAGLSLLGDKQTATRYLSWLASLKSNAETPLQVVYHINGSPQLEQHDRNDIQGYRGSLPVRIGNRAYNQTQLGSLGYLADCTLIHIEEGGEWQQEYWHMLLRIANFTAAHWRESDSGIWELPQHAQYTSSKVMSWVVLDRSVKLAARTGQHDEAIATWQRERDAIHADVMEHGWSERIHSFVQRYDAEALDGSLLLISVMGFLQPDHPRVCQTIERVVESLSINGLLYRFEPLDSPVEHAQPMGAFEGSFLPCTFWLATAYALAGQTDQADEVLTRAEALTQPIGLFAEEADARNGEFLGNYPLLFSQVEYIRAVLALRTARRWPSQQAQ